MEKESTIFDPLNMGPSNQQLTPNDKPKFSVAGASAANMAHSYDKNRISEKVSKVSGLSLSDIGEYNDAEKEKILALLEEQQNDKHSNTQMIKEIL